jgi:hypothetical protein
LSAEAAAAEKSKEWTVPETLATAAVAVALAAVLQVASELIVAITAAELEPRAADRSLYVTIKPWSWAALTDVAARETDSRDIVVAP